MFFPTETTQFNTDLKNVQNSVNNSIGGMTNPTGTNTTGGSNGNTWVMLLTLPLLQVQVTWLLVLKGNQTQNNTSSGSKSSIFDSIFGIKEAINDYKS